MGIAIQFANGGKEERFGDGILDLNRSKIKTKKVNGMSMEDWYANQIMGFTGELQQTEEELSGKQADYTGLDREKNGLQLK